ncbi:uncharacterized protein TNCV_3645371 [Trichonephila clavipes]|nr:uncharacterized protein TNCV_3645371 [Trichonephila clavipes]
MLSFSGGSPSLGEYLGLDSRLTPLVFQPACLPRAASRKEEMEFWGYLCVPFGPRFTVDGVSAADKGWRVYPLDPHPDAVALYSGCAPGKRRALFLPDDRHTASLPCWTPWWVEARQDEDVFSRIWIQVGCARVKALYCSTLISTKLLNV